VTLELTAPMTPGLGYTYTVFFVLSDGEAVSNPLATTIYLDVVVPDGPVDTTGPELQGMPADIATTTTGASAVVSWTDPTATDDVDPAPTVGCTPPSGSAFDLGTTTVTCTATDATGNSTSATFDVTVTLAAPTLTGAWAKPLDVGVPALSGRVGRNIPLKLTVSAGGHAQGPDDIAAPSLLVQSLAGCTTTSAVTGMQDAGHFAWSGSTWQLGLDTNGLGGGCMRLVARVDGETVMLMLANRTAWRFAAKGCVIDLTDSVYLAGLPQPRRTQQIVLKGVVGRHDRVNWAFRRIAKRDKRDAARNASLELPF